LRKRQKNSNEKKSERIKDVKQIGFFTTDIAFLSVFTGIGFVTIAPGRSHGQMQEQAEKPIKTQFMKIHLLCIIALVWITLSNQALSFPPEPKTVFLWPAKIKEFRDKPTEEISPNQKGNVTRLSRISSPSMTLYAAATSDKPAPAIVVCPGGGYSILAIDKEGTEIAKWLNSIGISAVVLKYSVPGKRIEALQDIQRAMGIVRQNAETWGIDPAKIGAMGFSAGANLTDALINSYQKRTYEPIDEADKLSCKPDFCMLIYPAWLDAKTVSENNPPTFIVQTKDDTLCKPTIPYAEALKTKKVPSEFHLFDVGGHGYGLRPSKDPVSKWPELCEKWLKQTITP
jgi:acetyl esterase/lipase